PAQRVDDPGRRSRPVRGPPRPAGRPEPRARHLTPAAGQVLVSVPLATGPVLPRKVNLSAPSGAVVSVTVPSAQVCRPEVMPWSRVSVPVVTESGLSWPVQENDALE